MHVTLRDKCSENRTQENQVNKKDYILNLLELLFWFGRKGKKCFALLDAESESHYRCRIQILFHDIGFYFLSSRLRPLIQEWAEEPVVVYPPVIEPEGSSDRPFLTADPLILFQSGNFSQVPWMTGSTDNESMVAAYEILQNQTLLDDMNENFERIIAIILNLERDSPESLRKGQRIKEFYFGNKPITQDSLQNLTDMYTESSFQYPVDRSVKLVSKVSSSPVYYYQFTYRGRYGHMPKLPGQERPHGAVHHDDLIYIFYGQGEYFPFFSSDFPEFVVSQRLVKMLANFARTGNPIPAKDAILQTTWQPYTPSNLAYMEIGDELKMKRSLRQDRVAFWDEIFSVHNSH